MVVLLDCCHPADVHFFRAIATRLEANDQRVIFTARPKDVTLPLLRGFGIQHKVIGAHHAGRPGKAWGLVSRSLALARFARSHNVGALVGFCDPYVAQAARLLRRPSLVLTDTETGHTQNRYLHPASVIATPSWFGSLRRPHPCHLAGSWFKELAYLADYEPDEKHIKELKKPYIIVRTVGWTAAHDRGLSRLLDPDSIARALGPELACYRSHEGKEDDITLALKALVPPHLIHHAIAGARLVITEGATLAAEAALMGVPTIYANRLQPAYLDELARTGILRLNPEPRDIGKLALESVRADDDNQRLIECRTRVRELVERCWPTDTYVADLIEGLLEGGTGAARKAHDRYAK